MSEERNITEELKSIAKGASLFGIGQIFTTVAGFLLNLLLARGLSTSLYGAYALIDTIISLSMVFTNLGSHSALVKYIPEYEGQRENQNHVFALALITSCISSAIIATLLYVFAPAINAYTINSDVFVTSLRIMSIYLVLNTGFKIIVNTFRSYELPQIQISLKYVLEPVLRVIFVLIFVYLGYSLIGVVIGLVLAYAASFIIGTIAFYRILDLRPSLTDTGISPKRFYNFSIPITFRDIGTLLYLRTDILMLGYLLTSEGVGIYNIAILISGVVVLPRTGFNQIFPPIASRLYTNNNHSKLHSIYSITTRWGTTVSLFMVIFAIVFREELLAVFGSSYTQGTEVLLVLLVGQFISNLAGPSDFILTMSNRQYLNLTNQWIFAVLNVILNFILIIEIGLIGAAIATAITTIGLNILRVSEVWYLEGYLPYSKRYWKVLVVAIVVLTISVILKPYVEGFLAVMIAGGIASVVFIVTISLMGLEDEEKKLFSQTPVGALFWR